LAFPRFFWFELGVSCFLTLLVGWIQSSLC
jgi:hypothetical protein